MHAQSHSQVRNPQLTAPQADRIRAFAARCLLGLARDAGIRNMLTKLQLGRLLSEIVREPGGGRRPTGAGGAAAASGSGHSGERSPSSYVVHHIFAACFCVRAGGS